MSKHLTSSFKSMPVSFISVLNERRVEVLVSTAWINRQCTNGTTFVIFTRAPGSPYQVCHPFSSKSQLKKLRGKEQSALFLLSAQGPWHQILKTWHIILSAGWL